MTRIITFIFHCLICLYCHGIIIETPDLEIFEKELENITDQDSFVLFDVDETLTLSKDRVITYYAKDYWYKLAAEETNNSDIMNKSEYFLGQILSKVEYELVNPKILSIISSLQKRKIKTIAFTKMNIGQLGVISSMEDWRIDHLKRLGIDFSETFPTLSILKFDVPESAYPSLFKEGVLYSNKQEKGPVLASFLNQIEWKPTKIYFIDNSLDFLKSVENALKKLGIDFIGFHYTEVEENGLNIDEKLVRVQLKHLARTGVWLTEREVKEQFKPANYPGQALKI